MVLQAAARFARYVAVCEVPLRIFLGFLAFVVFEFVNEDSILEHVLELLQFVDMVNEEDAGSRFGLDLFDEFPEVQDFRVQPETVQVEKSIPEESILL